VLVPALLLAALAAGADTIPAHESLIVASRELGENRLINVYTPPGYAATRRAYPVLYMPDGALDEDFPHIVSTIDSLIRLKRIRPVLVVGIPNTQRRRDLTGPTTVHSDSTIAPRVGGSAAFRRFIRRELMPEIRRRYRCSDETGIVGESLAGLFVVETLLLEPALFRHYIAFDPAIWWNNKELVRTAEARLARFPPGRRQLYLGAANTPGIGEETRELAGILKAHAPRALAWSFESRPDLEHSTIFRALAPGAFVQILR